MRSFKLLIPHPLTIQHHHTNSSCSLTPPHHPLVLVEALGVVAETAFGPGRPVIGLLQDADTQARENAGRFIELAILKIAEHLHPRLDRRASPGRFESMRDQCFAVQQQRQLIRCQHMIILVIIRAQISGRATVLHRK